MLHLSPGMVSHLQSLQEIAIRNGGTRSITSTGFNASLQYVKKQLEDNTDLILTVQPFSLNVSVSLTPASLSMVEPQQIDYATKDFTVVEYSGSSDLAARLIPAANFGCQPRDYPTSTTGKISLVSRGGCLFFEKVDNAIKAGARGVLIFNYPDEPGPVASSTLFKPYSIAVFTIPFSLGQQLLQDANAFIHMSYQSKVIAVYTSNLIAETRLGDPNTVVTIGSSLDSSENGPGMNENGSGSSANLQMALQFGTVVKKPANKVRFLWYGAEQAGAVGTSFYINSLSSAERNQIALNLNFDMIGSPNYIRTILNETETSGGLAIVKTFAEFFDINHLSYKISPPASGAVLTPFSAFGIPSGGIDTGSVIVKTREDRDRFGGLVGIPYDPCFLQPCDTLENVNKDVLLETAQAAAFALERFANTGNLPQLLTHVDAAPPAASFSEASFSF